MLSGNRNFEGRVHPEVKMNFLASPPLVVAYALAGTMDVDLQNDVLGTGPDGKPVLLANIWPSDKEVADAVHATLDSAMFRKSYANVFTGDANWQSIKIPAGKIYAWEEKSTYVRNPPYFDGMTMTPRPVTDVTGARVPRLARRLGDHRSHLAGRRHRQDQPGREVPGVAGRAADRLQLLRRAPRQSRSDDARHLRQHPPAQPAGAGHRGRRHRARARRGEQMSIFDAAMRYKQEGTPLVILAGKEYGTGSSRDWAAKGTMLLGVRAVIAESFERIHRSNLIGMGVLPLMFPAGKTAATLGLTGNEVFEITGLDNAEAKTVKVVATPPKGSPITFEARVRIDTPKERDYYRHGGILQYVLRQLAAKAA